MGPPDDPDAVVNHELKVKEILEPFSKTAVIIKYIISPLERLLGRYTLGKPQKSII